MIEVEEENALMAASPGTEGDISIGDNNVKDPVGDELPF